METGRIGCCVSLLAALAASAAGAQPELGVVAGQGPSAGVAAQVSHELTGPQTAEPARIVRDDFVAAFDATAERVAVFAIPMTNIYAIRVRLVELVPSGPGVLADLGETVASLPMIAVDSSDPELTRYELALDEHAGLREGARYGIEVSGLLAAPSQGDPAFSWQWAGAEGDGDIFVDDGTGFARLDASGVAFEIIGENLSPECPADVNGDGTLSPADFTAWIAAYNARSAPADQNGDGVVTPQDFSAWVSNYNAGC
ncbi:MAG: GC-type dockerin domain-anchored protein [Planctomycetota bacterium]